MTAAEPSAGEWLSRLRAGEVSAVELATHQLGLLHAADARLNAVAAVDDEQVLRDAAAGDRRRAGGDDGPLLGLPISIKDSLAVAGLPCLTGSAAREGNVPDTDATVVERVKRAGAVVLAKTTVPEYMWSYETEAVPHGRTLNAFDPARTSGGPGGGGARSARSTPLAPRAGGGAGRRRCSDRADGCGASGGTAGARSACRATTTAPPACARARGSCPRPVAGRRRARRACSTW